MSSFYIRYVLCFDRFRNIKYLGINKSMLAVGVDSNLKTFIVSVKNIFIILFLFANCVCLKNLFKLFKSNVF